MIPVVDLEGLRRKIVESGWEKVSEIENQPWGFRTVSVEDLNGYNLVFLEWLPGIFSYQEIYYPPICYLQSHSLVLDSISG